MGYSTQFKGQLTFTQPLSAQQALELSKFFGEDCRDHSEWNAPGLYYVDLKLTPDASGIQWDGAEKTYHLDQIVNVVLREMRKTFPDFGLVGTMVAQGDEIDDRWALAIGEDGWAHKLPLAPTGRVVTCPHCDQSFALEGAAS